MRDIRRRIWQTQPVSWLKRLFDSSVGPAVVAGSQSSRVLQTDPFKLPTVVAARQLIADTVSQFPLVALDAAGVQLDPVPAIVKRPNPAEPASDTFEKLTNALTRHGNAWLRVTLTGSNGYPLALEVVKNSRVTWELNSSGTSFARIEIDGIEQDRRLIQNVPFILESTPIGTSPLVEIRDVLVKLAAALDFSAQYYDQTAATPPYALISPTRLQADKATELLEAWTTARDENRPAVISGGLSLETFSPVSASDALMLEAIGQLDATIARVMQCPPLAAQHSSSVVAHVFDSPRRVSEISAHAPGVVPEADRSSVHAVSTARRDSPVRDVESHAARPVRAARVRRRRDRGGDPDDRRSSSPARATANP